ncbi:putative NmrA family protein [Streptomyces viridochromogenes Tue57]|uniref:Putative NmrA family protein n=1 Tax=Streptomyces viridochromogenes Tue57 TaxID=1160705 RepID=L8P3Q7_STRVR|nr:putative NmrA family protein [Streptomyces viridochromogenes Tue57]
MRVVEGSLTRPLECAHAVDGVEAVFLAGAYPSTIRRGAAAVSIRSPALKTAKHLFLHRCSCV